MKIYIIFHRQNNTGTLTKLEFDQKNLNQDLNLHYNAIKTVNSVNAPIKCFITFETI